LRKGPALTDPRLVTELLIAHGPLCERCLAYHARIAVHVMAATLERLHEHIAVRVEVRECPRCQDFTPTFSL